MRSTQRWFCVIVECVTLLPVVIVAFVCADAAQAWTHVAAVPPPLASSVVSASEQLPDLTGLTPTEAMVGDLDFTLTVMGSGFVQGSTVLWNDESRDTGFISSSMLTATIRASDLLIAGTAYVTVSNPGPNGGRSPSARLFAVTNPSPELAALDPGWVWAGSPTIPMTVTGRGLAPTSVVQIAGIDQETTFVDSGTVRVDVPEEALRYAAGLSVRVFTPPPGGGLSAPVFLWVYDDDVPPVTHAEGLEQLWNRRAVTLELVATDVGRGVAKTFYRVGSRGDYRVGNSVRIPAPSDHSNDGLKVVQFFSIDEVLNWEDPSKTVSVGIDTTPPSTVVRSATVSRGRTLEPRFRVNDALSPKARDALLQIIDRRGTVVARSALGEPTMRVWQSGPAIVVDLPRGTYRMRVLAHDLAGNAQSSTRSAVLTVR